jgi:uncharacterized protein YndB with AHSA1/START domain
VTDVRIDVDLTSPVTLVWRAVTEHHLLGEWFMPTDLLPVAGGVYRAFPPAGLPGLWAVFDIDVVEVVARQRLRMVWRAEQLHTEMVWELAELPGGGCRLSARQSGFLGLSGERRRADLLESYETLFRQRLPRLLERLGQKSRHSLDAEPVRSEPKKPWWKWFTEIPADRRMTLLSLLGAMVLTGLTATALAVGVLPTVSAPRLPREGGPPLGQGVQGAEPTVPAESASRPPATQSVGTPMPEASGPAAQASGVSAGTGELTATYRTTERHALGYTGSITVRAGGRAVPRWTATIDLPPEAAVTSAWDSADEQVEYRQERRRVVFAPAVARRALPAGGAFTFHFQVDDPRSVGAPAGCDVNDLPCEMIAN